MTLVFVKLSIADTQHKKMDKRGRIREKTGKEKRGGKGKGEEKGRGQIDTRAGEHENILTCVGFVIADESLGQEAHNHC